MTYSDFCKYFVEIHFSLVQNYANYISEALHSNGKKGKLYSVSIKTPGQYMFELHQPSIKGDDPEKI